MRDPDLVLRAQRAATALERAWHRWRTMHGLEADPLPPVSSYVGYSLEEPWGQPRVVFGVDAEEAEQFAAVLDGHDCIGPIHAKVAGLPGVRQSAQPSVQDRAADAGLVHVPAQAAASDEELPSDDPAAPGAGAFADAAAMQDPPAFREAAAARQTTAAWKPAGRKAAGRAVGGSAAGASASGHGGTGPGGTAPGGTGHGGTGHGGAVDGEAAAAAAEDPAGTDAPAPVAGGPASREAADSAVAGNLAGLPGLAAAGPEHGPGPARSEPTAGLSASPPAPDAAAPVENPARDGNALTLVSHPFQANPGAPSDSGGGENGPERPGPAQEPAVVAFRPGPELAAYLDEGPESDPFLDEPDDEPPAPADHARHRRLARGRSLPRLPRSKRAGNQPDPRSPAPAAGAQPVPEGRTDGGSADGDEQPEGSSISADIAGWTAGELPGQAASNNTTL